MTLNKRYKRNIGSSLPFYIASVILTAISLLGFYLFYIAGTGINNYGDDFFESHKREDASFQTYMPIPDNELTEIEDKFSVILEAEQYANIEDGNKTIRLFTQNDKIDLCDETDCISEPFGENDVMISKGYAVNNDIKQGDTIKILDKEFRVHGLFLRPDYLYMLQNTDDSYKNIETFFLAYVTEENLNELCSGQPLTNYKVIYSANTDKTAFRKYINDNYTMYTYLSAEDNPRITMVHDQADLFVLMSWILLILLPMITVALISIIIGRRVRSEQKIIGTMTALGYRKLPIMWHYSLLAIIPGILGGTVTAILTIIFAQPYGEYCLADYEPMNAVFTLPIPIAIAGIVIPAIIYLIAAMNKVRKLLKSNTVDLLAGTVGKKGKSRRIFIKSKMKVRKKFAFRSLVGNYGRSFVVFLGLFLGAFIISMGFGFVDCIEAIGDEGINTFGDMRYEYILNSLETEAPENGEPVIAAQFDCGEKGLNLIGLEKDTEIWKTELSDGSKAELNGKWYISSLASIILNKEKGDTITVSDHTTAETFDINIDGIIENNYMKFIVSDRDSVNDMLKLPSNTYNAVISTEKLELDSSNVASIFDTHSMSDQTDSMMDEMGAMIFIMILIGALICISALYVTIHMMISENKHNISMLKVLGYNSKEINSMILNTNHILLPIGIIFGILLSYLSLKAFCYMAADMANFLFPTVISIKTIIITVVSVSVCYFGSLFIMRGTAGRVDMVESLKDNRE